jgi:ferritin-like metal-binding protein YciE
MKLQTLQDLLVHELKDLYSAETQLVKALPKMVKAATNEELKTGFADHPEQTRNHVTRLEEAAKTLGCKLTGHRCKAMEGLIEEGAELISEDAEDMVRDAGLIGAAAVLGALRIKSKSRGDLRTAPASSFQSLPQVSFRLA